MAPVWDELFEDLVAVDGDGEEEDKEEEDVVDEDVVDREVDVLMVAVGIVVPVDSGALASRCAAAASNPSLIVTSRYAQAGTAVPEGMLSGKAST